MRKHTLRMMVTAVLLVMVLGCTTAVYGVTIAGGNVERNTSTGTGSAVGTTTSGGTTTYSTTRRTTGTGTALAGGTTAPAAGTATSAYTTRTNTAVRTGYLDDVMPFLIVMGIGVFMLLAFSHMQLNQTRYGKSEKYAKELKDFRRACSD